MDAYVTPCVGVWIETEILKEFFMRDRKSHPAWVCGLKRSTFHLVFDTISHTLRGCVD